MLYLMRASVVGRSFCKIAKDFSLNLMAFIMSGISKCK